jgi:hypothetical protein
VSADESREALESLRGRSEISAESQDGDRYKVAMQDLEGSTVTVLAPRMKVGTLDSLTLRFPYSNRIWTAAFDFVSAEYHSDDLAAVELELRAVEEIETSTRADRVEHHAPGKVRIIDAKHVLPRNEYAVIVEDTSETGVRFSCDFDVALDDAFTITANLEHGILLHVRARAVAVEAGPFGRKIVRARISLT